MVGKNYKNDLTDICSASDAVFWHQSSHVMLPWQTKCWFWNLKSRPSINLWQNSSMIIVLFVIKNYIFESIG